MNLWEAMQSPGNTENALPEDRNPGTPDGVLCEADGPVAVITINRPLRNAVNEAVTAVLHDLDA
jgi:hypothetical protein